ncbi:MAG: alkaline shock response membrane anchor protein AmaP [Bacillota bacterium]|nr:alkaline shock response membrane anchor protein AmaP [Bacillota bacterium]
MTVLDRVLLVLIFLALFVKGVLMLAVGLVGWDPRPWLADAGQAMLGPYRAETAVIGLAELAIAWYVLAWSARRRHMSRALIRETELGTIRISLKAVENLVQRAARQVQGVRDVKVDLRADKQGVSIHLAVTVLPDSAIPAISDELQHRVERYIAETVGVTVSRVAVTFRAVAEVGKARVE